MDLTSAILAVLLSRPASHTDVDASVSAREARLRPVAMAIAGAVKTEDEASAMLALGEHETHYAEHVLGGHCELMPKGERCDGGRARGPWQVHRDACPVSWQFAPGDVNSLPVEAGCAIRLMRWNAQRGRDHTLTPLHAAFCGFAAKAWGWPGADDRVRTTREISRALRKARWSE